MGKAFLEAAGSKGWELGLLTRRQAGAAVPGVRKFLWNPEEKTFDAELYSWPADALVNLAGENVGLGAWTEARKKAIRESRLQALETLAAIVKTWGAHPKIISMSASGYYGHVPGSRPVGEEHPPGRGFLSEVCVAWEGKANELFGDGRFRLTLFRLGVVLDATEGALPQMLRPVRFAFGQPLGSGSQMVPWIHRADVAESLCFALEHPQISGIFNLAAPTAVSNAELIKNLCSVAGRLYLPVPVPALALRLLLSEQADLVLQGVALDVSCWQRAGYEFKFPEFRAALSDILDSK